MAMPAARNKTEDDITAEVLQRFAETPDPRRHPWRPAHIHFVVSAKGYEPVTTHIFDRIDEYLGSDAVFAVKDSLIRDFVCHDVATGEAARLGIAPPFLTADFDFHFKPATEQGATELDAQQHLAALGCRGLGESRRAGGVQSHRALILSNRGYTWAR